MGRVRTHWTIRFLSLVLVSMLAWPAVAEEKTGDGKPPGKDADKGLFDSLSLTSRREPIHIRSRDLEFRYDEKRITYRGDVVVQQGDVTLKSDLLTVTYEEPATTNGGTATTASTTRQQLKEIIAEGNVDIVSGDRRATGKKAVFNEASRTLVLSGDAALREGANRVSGERVTVFLDEKRSVVEGGKDRAQMVFIPEPRDDGQRKKTP